MPSRHKRNQIAVVVPTVVVPTVVVPTGFCKSPPTNAMQTSRPRRIKPAAVVAAP
jgi:hypothetical protein